MVFTKTLTQTDIEAKLMVPNDFVSEFSALNSQNNGGAFDLLVRDKNGLQWAFRISNIKTGSNRRKLVVSSGWLSFVRAKKLQIGDCLSICKEGSGERMYRIEIKRSEIGKGPDKWTCLW